MHRTWDGIGLILMTDAQDPLLAAVQAVQASVRSLAILLIVLWGVSVILFLALR